MAKFLTKSRFNLSVWCPALLWYSTNKPETLPPIDAATQARFDQGTDTGLLAQTRFPGGVLVEGDFFTRPTNTARLLSRNVPLFEAAFSTDRLYCQPDILVPQSGGWHVIEVKSSTRVKDEHIADLSFQVEVMRRTGLNVTKASVAVIHNAYVKQGPIDAEQIFRVEDVTSAVDERITSVPAEIRAAVHVIDGPEPVVEEFHFCQHPYGCPLQVVPEIFQLYNDRNLPQKLFSNGIARWTELREEMLSSEKHLVQLRAHKTGTPQVNKEALREWLDKLEYPRINLDFETVNPAIPLFDGTRPYEHVPFQYSIHLQHADGTVEHKEFLGDGVSDPRHTLLTQLLQDIPSEGSVLAHNASFEKKVLESLARWYPEEEARINQVLSRLQDTITPFRNFWYYSPEQRGSCSLKAVLPALTGGAYDDLVIQDGGAAQLAYDALGKAAPGSEAYTRLRTELLAYCKRDTEAMVAIICALMHAAEDDSQE